MLQNHTKEHGHLAEITMDMSGKLQLGQSAAEIARTTSEDVLSEEELETLVTANQLDYEAPHRHRPPVSPPPPPVTLACCVYLAALLLCQAQLAVVRTEASRAAGATSALEQIERLVREEAEEQKSAYPPLPAS